MESNYELESRIRREQPIGKDECQPVAEFLNANQGRHGAIVRGMIGEVLRNGTEGERDRMVAILERNGWGR